MDVKTDNFLDYFFLVTTTVAISLGSVGVFSELFLLLGLANALAALGCKLIQSGELQVPKNIPLYGVFLLILLIHTYFLKGNFTFFWLFLSGGLLWLQVYNFQPIFKRYFSSTLVILGLLMGTVYFYSLKTPINLPNLVSLFAATTNSIKHSNLGDLWAVVLTVIFYSFAKKRARFYVPLIILGGYFLTISLSRAALVSLTAGVFYIFHRSKDQKAVRKYLHFFLLAVAVLFVYAGISKTVLLSRPYFLQAIVGFAEYPLGTGLGNFTLVSNSSNYVHNIVLEVFSGMGIFSAVFIIWLYKTTSSILTGKNTNSEAGAVFLATLTNFCFSTTYIIPAFIWVWFISLALTQPKQTVF